MVANNTLAITSSLANSGAVVVTLFRRGDPLAVVPLKSIQYEPLASASHSIIVRGCQTFHVKIKGGIRKSERREMRANHPYRVGDRRPKS